MNSLPDDLRFHRVARAPEPDKGLLRPLVAVGLAAGLLLGCSSSNGIEAVADLDQQDVQLPTTDSLPVQASPMPSGNSPSASSSGGIVDEPDSVGYFENVAARRDALTSDRAYVTLLEALPNVRFEFEDGSVVTASDIAVIGKVASVELVGSFADPESNPELADSERVGDGVLVPADDSRVLWRTFEVFISAQEIVASTVSLDDPGVVRFKVSADGSVPVDEVERSLVTDSAVFVIGRFVDSDSSLRDSEVFQVSDAGGFWFEVQPSGQLVAPALTSEEEDSLQVSSLTIDEVRSAVREPVALRPAWERD